MHSPPQFGCPTCIIDRGTIYDSNLDYQIDRLNGLYNALRMLYNKELPDDLADDLDLVINTIESIVLELSNEASVDTSTKFLGLRSSDIARYSTPDHSSIKPSKSRHMGRKGKDGRMGDIDTGGDS